MERWREPPIFLINREIKQARCAKSDYFFGKTDTEVGRLIFLQEIKKPADSSLF
jgi:hypothetical protein